MTPEIIATDMQRLEQDAIVQVFEIDATQYGSEVMHFATAAVDGQPISFGGVQYLPFPIQAEGFEWNGQGTLPRPTLLLAAQDLAFLSLVMSANDLVGAPVRRKRTYRKHLDDGSDPDPEAMFPTDHYVIERKARQNRTQIQFELSVQMDQEGRMIPARQVLRDTCTHRYRWWDGAQYRYEGVTCPYAGTGEWTESGASADRGADRCGKRLSDCKLRFGVHGLLPFYGFPGVARYR